MMNDDRKKEIATMLVAVFEETIIERFKLTREQYEQIREAIL